MMDAILTMLKAVARKVVMFWYKAQLPKEPRFVFKAMDTLEEVERIEAQNHQAIVAIMGRKRLEHPTTHEVPVYPPIEDGDEYEEVSVWLTAGQECPVIIRRPKVGRDA